MRERKREREGDGERERKRMEVERVGEEKWKRKNERGERER